MLVEVFVVVGGFGAKIVRKLFTIEWELNVEMDGFFSGGMNVRGIGLLVTVIRLYIRGWMVLVSVRLE